MVESVASYSPASVSGLRPFTKSAKKAKRHFRRDERKHHRSSTRYTSSRRGRYGQWIQRQYTKGEIDRAGARLIPWWKFDVESLDDLHIVYRIVQNWRTSHAMPLLAFRMSLQNRARRVEPNAIVAQRLKRFSSVLNKLIREPTMQLSQMQDLGGCRAIVSNMDALNRLYALYQEDQGNQGLFHAEGAMKCYDYILNPKSDGYRGIHVVGRYRARIRRTHDGTARGSRFSCALNCSMRLQLR